MKSTILPGSLRPDYDVTVVGAGLAGLQCARLLGRFGLRTLLVDRKSEVGVPVHTTGIFVRKTLEDFEFPQACLGPAIRDVLLYSPSGRCLSFRSSRDEFRLCRMRELYAAFLEDARGNGVDWAPGHRFLGARRVESGLEISFHSGGASRVTRSRFLIGADGVLSPVAGALGLSRNQEWIVGIEDVAPFEGSRIPGDRAEGPVFHCFLDPELAPGYIGWVIEDPATGVHVGVGGYPGRFQPAEALERFKTSIARRFPITWSGRIERRVGRIPVGGVLSRLAMARGLLVGDAAGAASPLTAGGLDASLRLSEYAARVTRDYLVSAAEDTSPLEAYCGARLARRLISRRLMRRLFSTLASRRGIELAFSLLGLPPCRWLAEQVFFGRGSFPDPDEPRVDKPGLLLGNVK